MSTAKRPVGRPKGVTMPCGWCGKRFTAAGMRDHFANCEKKPQVEVEAQTEPVSTVDWRNVKLNRTSE